MGEGLIRAGGNLGTILREYRRARSLTQQQLADMLGYDRTYISMIESGRRNPADRETLAHIARTLAIPPHVLGIASPDDADSAAMLAFGNSVIRLAATARHSGRAADAVSELWPLTAAISDTETLRLPHQIQRIIRLASEPPALTTVYRQARAALTRLNNQLTDTESLPRTPASL